MAANADGTIMTLDRHLAAARAQVLGFLAATGAEVASMVFLFDFMTLILVGLVGFWLSKDFCVLC